MKSSPKPLLRPRVLIVALNHAPELTGIGKYVGEMTAYLVQAGFAVKVIAAIGKLSGSGYEYAPEQIAKVGEHLKNAVNGAMRKFDKTSKEATAPEITI